jgi:ADP-heptose:LPS heptosyltransferase
MRSERALLVAVGGGIGDTLLAGVVGHALRSRYAEVDALVLPEHRAVVAGDPTFAAVHAMGGLWETAVRMRAEQYAAAIVTWATLPNALLPLLAGIPVRVGQARRLYSGAFNRRVVVRSELGDRTTHWTQILLDYARAIDCDDAVALPTFVPSAADRRVADDMIRERGWQAGFALLHATRGIAAQREAWPTLTFARLASALHARDGIAIGITGSHADARVAQTIAQHAGPDVASLAGVASLGVYAALAERARYVVAMDSGPMHLAAAVGAPTVGVFAMQCDEPDRWAPLGPHVAVVLAEYACPAAHRKETCPDFACIAALDPARVISALAGLAPAIAERV